MSGDQHNQADPLNLDAIEARGRRLAAMWQYPSTAHQLGVVDVPALVAEVRRLRAWSAQAAFNAELAGSDGDV